jgi:predicted tellurium resistance membrane protein TerC
MSNRNMSRRLRALSLVVFAVLLGSGWLLSAEPATKSGPKTPVNIELELTSKAIITAKLLTTDIRFQSEYGVVELDQKKVKQLEFLPPEEGTTAWQVNVILLDKSHLLGTILTDTLSWETPTGTVSAPVSEIAVVKFLHPKDTSLLAALIGLLTLALMEIILGVDNIIFLAILAGKLPEAERPRARRFGLIAALVTRLMLLLGLSWIMGLTKPLFTLPALPMFNTLEARGISGRDLVLLLGGLFLIWKSVREMHHKVESASHDGSKPVKTSSFWNVIFMIAIADIVFSLDSVITAVGMVDEVWVMMVAMVIAMFIMMIFAGPISNFVDKHPTVKILALSFLVLIGVILMAEGLGQHIDKGYIYFAMAFAVIVEIINLQFRRKARASKSLSSTETRPVTV